MIDPNSVFRCIVLAFLWLPLSLTLLGVFCSGPYGTAFDRCLLIFQIEGKVELICKVSLA